MDFVVILAVLFVLAIFLTGPLRRTAAERSGAEQAAEMAGEVELADLEAAREAKYREIRDAELDHETGKLSDEDYAEVDATLRAEALEILDALDEAGATMPRR